MLVIAMKSEKIEKGYQLMLVSLIKKCMELKDPKKFDEWYVSNSMNMKKNFALALSMSQMKMDEDYFYADTFYLKISSNDILFLSNIRAAIAEIKQFKYKDTALEFVGTDFIVTEKPIQHIVVANCISPLYLRMKNGDLPQTNEQLEDSFCYYAGINIQAAVGREPIEPITLLQHEFETKLIDVRMHHFYKKKVTYRGPFVMKGHPDDLYLLLQSGIGMNTSLGFGLVERVM
jgi:CRISPR-associated endoribonuclease Cas6